MAFLRLVLFLLVDSRADTLLDEAMPHNPDSKDERSDCRGGELETDYHWLLFDSPLHENLSSAVKGCGGAEFARKGVPRIGRLC